MDYRQRISSYLRYLRRARTRYAVHSPFVFELTEKVIRSGYNPVRNEAESWKKDLLQSNVLFEIEDFGAGYGQKNIPQHTKTAREVIKSSARNPKEGGLLYRLVDHLKPTSLLELGTNLGFSTLYLAHGAAGAPLVTIEGASSLSAAASTYLHPRFPNIEFQVGEFSSVLNHTIDWTRFAPEFVLLDGNHRYAPTMAYFNFLLEKMPAGSTMVLDDIHWSEEMERAWKEITKHPQVTVSIDLYHMGIVFVNRPQVKQHFVLRF